MHTMIGRCVAYTPSTGRAPAEFVLRNGDTCRVFRTFRKSPLSVGNLYAIEYRDNDREHNGKWYAGRLAEAVAECREDDVVPSIPKQERVPDSAIPPGNGASAYQSRSDAETTDSQIPF